MRGAGAVNVRAAELAGVAGALARTEMAGIHRGRIPLAAGSPWTLGREARVAGAAGTPVWQRPERSSSPRPHPACEGRRSRGAVNRAGAVEVEAGVGKGRRSTMSGWGAQ